MAVADPVVRELWMVSGGASLLFLSWALVQMTRLTRHTGPSPARGWFLVFLAAMAGVATAGLAGAAPLDLSTVLIGACLAAGGYALHRAAQTQRVLLEAQAAEDRRRDHEGAPEGSGQAGGAAEREPDAEAA